MACWKPPKPALFPRAEPGSKRSSDASYPVRTCSSGAALMCAQDATSHPLGARSEPPAITHVAPLCSEPLLHRLTAHGQLPDHQVTLPASPIVRLMQLICFVYTLYFILILHLILFEYSLEAVREDSDRNKTLMLAGLEATKAEFMLRWRHRPTT